MTHLQLHELYYNLACVLHQQGNLLMAVKHYQKALELNPHEVKAHHNLAVALDEQGHLSAAIECYRRVIELHPTYVYAYINLGKVFVKQGHPSNALPLYRQALALQPQAAQLYVYLGQAYLALGQDHDAIATFDHALVLDPRLEVAHYYAGKAWQQRHNHAAAIQSFQAVLQLNPASIAAHSECGVSWLAQGKLAPAMFHFCHAIALQPQFVEFYCQRVSPLQGQDAWSQAQIACGQFLAAIRSQSQVEQAFQHLVDHHTHLAKTLMTYGGYPQYKAAETYYRKVLTLQPDNFNVHLLLHHCLMQQQDLQPQVQPHNQPHPLQQTPAQSLMPQLVAEMSNQPQPISHDLATQGGKPETTVLLQSVTEPRPSIAIVPLQPIAAGPSPTCEGLNCAPCLQHIRDWFHPIHLGHNIYMLTTDSALPVHTPATHVTALPQGRIWVAPQQNDWLICNAIAIFTADDQLRLDLSREYPGQLPGCAKPNSSYQRSLQIQDLPALEQVNGRVAILAGLSGHVYFHWMADILPRWRVLQQARYEVGDIDWVLVNSRQRPFQQRTLNLLGIPDDKILESDRHPHIQADHLLVPEFASDLGWLTPTTIEFLRQSFLPWQSLTPSDYPQRIYISRATARYRQVINEAAVVQQLAQWGFVSVTLESLSFETQIALFANAKVIIAPHGSGLTNLLFCQPGTTVVELFSPHYVRHYYWNISHTLQLQHYYVTATAFDCAFLRSLMYQNPLLADIWVNVETLQRVCDGIFNHSFDLEQYTFKI